LKLPDGLTPLVLEKQLDAELPRERLVARERHKADVVGVPRRRVEHRQQRPPRPQAAGSSVRQRVGQLAAHGVEVVLEDHRLAGRRAAWAQADRPREAAVRHFGAGERADEAGDVGVDSQGHGGAGRAGAAV
jgi:hypothetical protein